MCIHTHRNGFPKCERFDLINRPFSLIFSKLVNVSVMNPPYVYMQNNYIINTSLLAGAVTAPLKLSSGLTKQVRARKMYFPPYIPTQPFSLQNQALAVLRIVQENCFPFVYTHLHRTYKLVTTVALTFIHYSVF